MVYTPRGIEGRAERELTTAQNTPQANVTQR
jgi:hypothetical protein